MNFDGYANEQNLIDAWRKRLCKMATKEARELAMDFKAELRKTHPAESDVLVPNCIYRMGCPEFDCCTHVQKFKGWCEDSGYDLIDLMDIQLRYDLYNEFFYSEVYNDDRIQDQDEKDS